MNQQQCGVCGAPVATVCVMCYQKQQADYDAAYKNYVTQRDENERLRRENGSLARTYAACEELLRERTKHLNAGQAENERLRAALVKHHELLTDEPDDLCWDCGLAWDGTLGSGKAR